MEYNSKIHHRRSIRAQGYDYSRDSAYFVTICAQDMKCVFGNIERGEMRLNGAGEMVDFWWRELPNKFQNIRLDEFTVMPNHFHGILVVGAILCNRPEPVILNSDFDAGENIVSPLRKIQNANAKIPNTYAGLGQYVSWFKRMTTNEYIRNVKIGKFPPFEKSVWQRNYWEHIIRDDDELDRIRGYIVDNPSNWEIDEFYSQK